MRAVRSLDEVRIRWPSFENVAWRTRSSCPESVARIAPVEASQIFAVPSSLAVRIHRPTRSGENPTRAVTASQDGAVKLWDTKENKEILTLDGHTREVTSVAFSPDGKYVLTASEDGRAILWLTSPWQTALPKEKLTKVVRTPVASGAE